MKSQIVSSLRPLERRRVRPSLLAPLLVLILIHLQNPGLAQPASGGDQNFTYTLGSVVTNGVPVAGAGNLEAAGVKDIYSFQATAGAVLYFHDLGASAAIDWALFDANNNQLFRDRLDGNSPGRVQMPATGTYQVRAFSADDGSHTGTYSFEIHDAADQTFQLVFGQVVTNGVPAAGAGNIEIPGTVDFYPLKVAAGQVLFFHDLGATAAIDWGLYDSNGGQLFRDRLDGNSPGRVQFTTAGTYQLRVFSADDLSHTGTYSFEVHDAADQTFQLVFGQVVTNGVPAAGAGNIEIPGTVDFYPLKVAAGQVLFFHDLGATAPIDWGLYDSNGSQLFRDRLDGYSPGRVQFTTAGTYQLRVFSADDLSHTGTFSFEVHDAADQTFQLVVGQVVTNGVPAAGAGNIEIPGTVDFYPLKVAAGQVLFFHDLGATAPIDWGLYDSNGSQLFRDRLDGYSPGRVQFTTAGTYQLRVFSADDLSHTGTYSFEVHDAADQTFQLVFGQVVTNGVPAAGAGNIEIPGTVDFYPLQVVAGQVLFFHDLGATAPIDWGLYDSNGSQLFRDRLDGNSPGRVQMPSTGTYQVRAFSADDGSHTGTYSFEVHDPADQTFPLTLGQVVTNGVPAIGAGNIEIPGTMDIYTFTAANGQLLYFHDLGASAAIDWALFDSKGNQLWRSRLNGNDSGRWQAPAADNYPLRVFSADDGSHTGTYSFEVHNRAGQTFPLTLGQVVTNGVPAIGAGNIEIPGTIDTYTFTAANGQLLYFHDLGASAAIDWALFDSNGNQLWRSRLNGNDSGRWQAPAADNYQLRVFSADDGSHTGTYSFEVHDPADQTFPLTIAQVVTNGVPAAGAGVLEIVGTHDNYTFQVTPGTVLYFRDLGSSGPVDWQLLDSAGQQIFRTRLNGLSSGNVTLVKGGNYTLVALGAGNEASTGTYSFEILKGAPTIINQPQPEAVVVGRTATFSVTVSSDLPVHYQWQFRNGNLPGATNSTLTLSNVQVTQVGDYFVLVSNDTGSTYSAPAHLSVRPLIPAATAARAVLPSVPGNGVAIDLFNGVGGGPPPSPDLLVGRTPDGRTLSPVIDFPHPGQTINVGNSFNNFFSDTTTPPDEVLGLSAQNFILRNTFYLRVSADLDQDVSTPEIDFQLGVGSDDGFYLTIGTNVLGSSGDRGFSYSWMPVAFEAEGLYPVTLLYSANAVGSSGLELSWMTAATTGGEIIPQSALYVAPNIGDQLITFEEVPSGTALTNQFASRGVVFRTQSGALQVTTNFPARFIPVSPTHVFGDATVNPTSPGQMELGFVVPGTATTAVTDFISLFIINGQDPGATVTAFDATGAVAFTNSFHAGAGSQELVTIAQPRIAKVQISLGQGSAAAAIDNLSFTTPVSGADLIPGAVTGPTLAGPGDEVTISWAITNAGITSVSQPWTDQIVLTSTTGSPVVLGSFLQTQPLGPGAVLMSTQTLIIPTSGPAGSARISVRADVLNDVAELNEQNNTAFAADGIDLPNWLNLQFDANSTPEGGPPVTATLTRNGDLTAPLTLVLTNSRPDKLQAPAQIVLAAGQAAAQFEVSGLTNGVVDGAQLTELSVGTPGYVSASATITIEDINKLELSLQVPAGPVAEGSIVKGKVSRDAATPDPVDVFLTVSLAASVSLPLSVTIPANAQDASFDMMTVDDQAPTLPRSVTLTASAAGYQDSPAATIIIADADVPGLTFTVTKNLVSEGDGPQAISGTLRTSTALGYDVSIALESSNTNAVRVPGQVTIPAGQSSVSFPIAAIDNSVVEPSRDVVLSAYVIQASTGAHLSNAYQVKVTVTDNDGPALQLSLDHNLVNKGLNPAATATIKRSASLAQALTIALSSSDTIEATLSPTVTLAAGQASATVPISTGNDGQAGSTHAVIITATAPGYSPGAETLVVSDVLLPDLVVTDVSGPATADTEAYVNVTYRIVNQGFAPASTNILTRVFLSSDNVVGDDLLVGDFQFTGTLPPSQFFEQTLQVRLPTAPGDYWLVVSTDVENHVPEVLKDNNTTMGSEPLHVRAAYTATVTADVTTAPAGTPVHFHGTALKAGSTTPAPDVPVHLHLFLRDTDRVLLAVTDDQGNFNTTFDPLPNEAGSYAVAAAHPGVTNPPPQIHFTIVGLRARVPDQPVKLVAQANQTVDIPLENLSEVPLSGLKAVLASGPANVTASATLAASGNLPGLGSSVLEVVLSAKDASVAQGTVVFHLTSAEGAIADVAIPVAISSLQPLLSFSPDPLIAGMKRGDQTVVDFEIVNAGGAAPGPISVVLPDLPWLKVVSVNPLAALAPGQTNRISLRLQPAADLALGDYDGSLLLRAGDLTASLPFTFRALSEAKGDLRITAVDEYTYYADGSPPVTNATVTVRDSVSGTTLTNGVTDALGQFFLPQLFEGYYDVEVGATNHIGFRGTSFVRAGITNDVQAFLSRETVHYTWTVVPTQIQDRTTISIETTFETFVPIPVVTIEPAVIDLATITADVTQIDLHISNHGLIAANDFRLGFSAHPDWQLEPLVSEIGALPARSSLVVPLTIRRLNSPSLRSAQRPLSGRPVLPQGGGGPCGIFGGGVWNLLCGTIKTYSTPVQVLNAGGDCGGGGGGSWGGNGSAAAPFVSVPSFPTNIKCGECKPMESPELQLGFVLKPLAKAAAAVVNKYLEAQAWNIFLGIELEIDPDVKGKIGICCTNNNPMPEISAEVSGEFKLTSNKRNIKIPIKDTINNFQWGSTNGTALLDGSLSIGSAAEPAVKLSGSYKSGCGMPKPEWEISAGGSVSIKSGIFGDVTTKLQFPGLPGAIPVTGKSEIKGGLQGNISFTYTINSEGKSKFCYNSDGLYLIGTAKILGFSTQNLFPPSGKFYLIQTNQVCDPPDGSPEFAMLRDFAKQLMQQATDEVAAHQAQALRTASTPTIRPHTDQPDSGGGGICAQVRLKLDQDLILTRNAFNATLELDNNDPANPLEDISVQVSALTADGRDATDLFVINTNSLAGITAVDGTGMVAPSSSGTASWILIPTHDAAPDQPTAYQVGGVLSYSQGGQHVIVPLAPVPITVQPDPRLEVKYFHQRDVFADDPFTPIIEPSVPFSLAVMIQNSGKGIANNVRITSSQPKIIDNEKGLLIDFKIIGTEVAGQPATPSLTADFGTINPGETSIGRWLLTSTLQGLFVEYSATIEHTAGPQDAKTALVDDVSIHEMIHLVQAPGKLDDGKPDFLVNDDGDPEALPDTLYLSDGSTNYVQVVREASVGGQLSAGNLSVQVSATLPPGWSYLQVPDPGQGKFKLLRVMRSDGVEIRMGTNVWTSDRTFIGQGRKPKYENLLHLLDYNSTGAYTLSYGPLPPLETIPPSSHVDPLPANSYAQIPVTWSGSDNPGGSGVDYYDIYVSENGGPFTLWLAKDDATSAVYNGKFGSAYAFYSVATDNAGNREADRATADTSTSVTRVNHAPALDPIPDHSVNEGDLLVVTPTATDPDNEILTWSLVNPLPAGVQINPNTGLITWLTAEGMGNTTNQLTVQVLDNGIPRLGSVRRFHVFIAAENHAPELPPITDRTVAEGQLLVITNNAVDPDLPPQHLIYQLAAGAPAGVSLDAHSGIFNWRPNEVQGGTNYPISIIVTDDGTPSLSATQSFRINVLDTRSDFAVSLGTTNMLVGTTNALPVLLAAHTDLTNLLFRLTLPDSRLSQFTLQPVAPEVATSVLSPAGGNQAQVQLSAGPNQVLPSGKPLALLRFIADQEDHSALISFDISDVSALRSTGERLSNVAAQAGRVFLLGREPLLDAQLTGGQRTIVLYTPGAHDYQVQFRTNLFAGPGWAVLSTIHTTSAVTQLSDISSVPPPVFYRAMEVATGLRLEISWTGSAQVLLVHGDAGKTYNLQSNEFLSGQWKEEQTIVLTNAVQELDGLLQPQGKRFFRLQTAQ